jgi:hypothetical protein
MSSTSCKNDIEQIVEEDPVFYLLSQPNIIIDTVTSTAKKWDYGFAFNTTKKGNVQKLGLVLPVVGKFKVKLFALSNDSILIEKEIESKKSGSKNFLDIKSIPLSTNSEYGISVNANSFYKMRKPDSTNFAFPMKIGNINLLSFNEQQCTSQNCDKFPKNANSLVIAPCVTIIFVPED